MKAPEKMVIITSTLHLMVGRIQEIMDTYKELSRADAVSQENKIRYAQQAKEHEDELETILKTLAETLEEVGNYVDNCELLTDDPELLRIVNQSFENVNGK